MDCPFLHTVKAQLRMFRAITKIAMHDAAHACMSNNLHVSWFENHVICIYKRHRVNIVYLTVATCLELLFSHFIIVYRFPIIVGFEVTLVVNIKGIESLGSQRRVFNNGAIVDNYS